MCPDCKSPYAYKYRLLVAVVPGGVKLIERKTAQQTNKTHIKTVSPLMISDAACIILGHDFVIYTAVTGGEL